MEPYQYAFNQIHASEDFKRRMVVLMQTHNTPRAVRTVQKADVSLIPAKRKALLIVIAAVLLPSRTTGDLLAGMWQLLSTNFKAVPKTLV